MAYTTLTTEHAVPGLGRLRQILQTLRQRMKQRAEYRRTYRALQNLSNRELADIGLNRCDIARVARCNVTCL
ncbi:DUF1127 domain-containing protein [Phaeobacter sp. QD34_3]|uniref:DUF1127 domain-containing protein n=1 Tax=unclassified Phaeobacter TaxID=2621772 RepID=UPI00237FBCB9|nr:MULTISPECIES: DUF1127 domain-containing protein [unclassified Phaeobacter]MDE4134690.1 DUF1127 domain-containing protein [Phaeobacter sp. QD34_3]MDE4138340.1 DUF1127 domain-containing protein [Phaeobacter sp. QD34_24]